MIAFEEWEGSRTVKIFFLIVNNKISVKLHIWINNPKNYVCDLVDNSLKAKISYIWHHHDHHFKMHPSRKRLYVPKTWVNMSNLSFTTLHGLMHKWVGRKVGRRNFWRWRGWTVADQIQSQKENWEAIAKSWLHPRNSWEWPAPSNEGRIQKPRPMRT